MQIIKLKKLPNISITTNIPLNSRGNRLPAYNFFKNIVGDIKLNNHGYCTQNSNTYIRRRNGITTDHIISRPSDIGTKQGKPIITATAHNDTSFHKYNTSIRFLTINKKIPLITIINSILIQFKRFGNFIQILPTSDRYYNIPVLVKQTGTDKTIDPVIQNININKIIHILTTECYMATFSESIDATYITRDSDPKLLEYDYTI